MIYFYNFFAHKKLIKIYVSGLSWSCMTHVERSIFSCPKCPKKVRFWTPKKSRFWTPKIQLFGHFRKSAKIAKICKNRKNRKNRKKSQKSQKSRKSRKIRKFRLFGHLKGTIRIWPESPSGALFWHFGGFVRKVRIAIRRPKIWTFRRPKKVQNFRFFDPPKKSKI